MPKYQPIPCRFCFLDHSNDEAGYDLCRRTLFDKIQEMLGTMDAAIEHSRNQEVQRALSRARESWSGRTPPHVPADVETVKALLRSLGWHVVFSEEGSVEANKPGEEED